LHKLHAGAGIGKKKKKKGERHLQGPTWKTPQSLNYFTGHQEQEKSKKPEGDISGLKREGMEVAGAASWKKKSEDLLKQVFLLVLSGLTEKVPSPQ